MVAATMPPMTARASGAVCSLPSLHPTAIGTMPAVIAQLVIRIGRSRPFAPSDAAAAALAPFLAAVLLGERHQQNRIGDRDADGHDRPHERLKVDRCPREPEHQHDAGDAAGVVETTTRASFTDWKFAVSSSRITMIDIPRPMAEALEDLLHRPDLPAHVDGRTLGRHAGALDRPLDLTGDATQILAGDVGGQAHRSASCCSGHTRPASFPD